MQQGEKLLEIFKDPQEEILQTERAVLWRFDNDL
jgi:hypothetical protein